MKNIVAVFAHPDDEAFMCSGTIAKLAQSHRVYILCVTKGDADPKYAKDIRSNLSDIRTQELEDSAKILGVKKVHFLGFKDGSLCNNIYHQLAEKIEEKLKIYRPETLITIEPRGVSGHLDHVATSLITTYVFYRLPFIKKLMYYCITEEHRQLIPDYFIYFPPGYKKSQINEVINVSHTWDKKIKSIKAHVSQKKDGLRVLSIVNQGPRQENFLVLNK